MRHTCQPGRWLYNQAPLGEPPDWIEQIEPPAFDPNDTRLFGYDQQAFLKRQYKGAT
jgi:hypothetical protein